MKFLSRVYPLPAAVLVGLTRLFISLHLPLLLNSIVSRTIAFPNSFYDALSGFVAPIMYVFGFEETENSYHYGLGRIIPKSEPSPT
jgi:hypothetical protein